MSEEANTIWLAVLGWCAGALLLALGIYAIYAFCLCRQCNRNNWVRLADRVRSTRDAEEKVEQHEGLVELA